MCESKRESQRRRDNLMLAFFLACMAFTAIWSAGCATLITLMLANR
jgi:hypothetical protein